LAKLNWEEDKANVNKEPKARRSDSVFFMVQAS
jgi:hypothetical protein